MSPTNSLAVRNVSNAPNSITPEDIATEEHVVHPALDWRDQTLVMGAQLSEGGRAVLTSRRQILSLEQLQWPICERSRSFSRSPVTTDVARRFLDNYGSPTNSESAYALVNVPSQLAAYYKRFIVFPTPWWPEILALWTLGTYLYPIFSAYPYLRISSPEPGCGKSLLGQIIANLSFNGEFMSSPTASNIFRMAESERGTQVWDEVENESHAEQNRLAAMQDVLLHGYRSGGAVPRQEPSPEGGYTTVRFHIYVPRVLIGLSALPSVVQQRTLELMLQRRSLAEPVEQYRHDERLVEENELRGLCALYALSYSRATANCYRNQNLAHRLEFHVGQAGRLTSDLLLPLIAVGAAPRDNDSRSRSVVDPMLRRIITQAAPELARRWSEGGTTTPAWLPEALQTLRVLSEPTPGDVAELVMIRSGFEFSPEQMSHQLKRYGLRTVRRNGRRVYALSTAELAQLQARYGQPSHEEEGPTEENSTQPDATGQ